MRETSKTLGIASYGTFRSQLIHYYIVIWLGQLTFCARCARFVSRYKTELLSLLLLFLIFRLLSPEIFNAWTDVYMAFVQCLTHVQISFHMNQISF